MSNTDEITICNQCRKLEYDKNMHWVHGKYVCRRCYNVLRENAYNETYDSDNLEPRPRFSDYRKQCRKRYLASIKINKNRDRRQYNTAGIAVCVNLETSEVSVNENE